MILSLGSQLESHSVINPAVGCYYLLLSAVLGQQLILISQHLIYKSNVITTTLPQMKLH